MAQYYEIPICYSQFHLFYSWTSQYHLEAVQNPSPFLLTIDPLLFLWKKYCSNWSDFRTSAKMWFLTGKSNVENFPWALPLLIFVGVNFSSHLSSNFQDSLWGHLGLYSKKMPIRGLARWSLHSLLTSILKGFGKTAYPLTHF